MSKWKLAGTYVHPCVAVLAQCSDVRLPDSLSPFVFQILVYPISTSKITHKYAHRARPCDRCRSDSWLHNIYSSKNASPCLFFVLPHLAEFWCPFTVLWTALATWNRSWWNAELMMNMKETWIHFFFKLRGGLPIFIPAPKIQGLKLSNGGIRFGRKRPC